MRFVSERALALHKMHIEEEKVRLALYEKTYPDIVNNGIKGVLRSRYKEKREILKMALNIRCHELYFSSFDKHYTMSSSVRSTYGTEASFLYEIRKYATKCDKDFIFIYSDGEKVFLRGDDEVGLLKAFGNVLVIDLKEHSYFLDYGFDREEYVRRLLPHLNLSILDKKISLKD